MTKETNGMTRDGCKPAIVMAGIVHMIMIVAVVGCGTGLAHDLSEVKDTLAESDDIPSEILEATRMLESTAGTSSVRDRVHEKQHQLLLEHVRVRTKRKCQDLITRLPSLDQEIISLREAGRKEEEQTLRDVRETAQQFVTTNCSSVEGAP